MATAQINNGLRKLERARIEELLSGSQLVKRGWVNGDAWKQAWAQYWDGADEMYPDLVAGISVEAWLRVFGN